MEQKTLLIADPDEAFVWALRQHLEPEFQVLAVKSGEEALAIQHKEPCQVLLMDMELPKMDGISLLKALLEESVQPEVLAFTRLNNPQLIQDAGELGARYLLRKPCDMASAAELAQQLGELARTGVEDPRVRRLLYDWLTRLGISAKWDGYDYLVDCVVRTAQSPRLSLTKELYPAVAQDWGCTARQVERCIRTALNTAWEQRDPEIWYEVLGPVPCHLSNGHFITRMARKLRIELGL